MRNDPFVCRPNSAALGRLLRLAWLGLLSFTLLAATGCGSDSSVSDAGDDALFGFDQDAADDLGDAPELGGGLALGELCEADGDCLSERCQAFGDDSFCTEACDTLCAPDDMVCWDDLCTPDDYCDDSEGPPGDGPGCPGSICLSCAAQGSTCVPLDDDYNCICQPGWSGDGFSCDDLDECTLATDDCADEADCTNSDGSFTCACPGGFTGDGTVCDDIDECAGTNDCDSRADCENTVGGFACTCPGGFTGDGTVCTDVDECAGANDCDANADCENNPGSFICTCRDGYTGTGRLCTLITYAVAGDLTTESPGQWADGTFADSCQAYRYPELPYLYEGGASGDGWYRVLVTDEPAATVDVFCDMTTDGGGWTAIDADTAAALEATIADLTGTACLVVDGHPEGVAAGDIYCRFDVDTPFVFNALRLDGVVIEALSADAQVADLTQHVGDWGTQTCNPNRGDVTWGSAAHPGPVLSLGDWFGVAACTAGPSFAHGTLLDWDGAEAATTRDQVLRLELAEFGGEVEGWRWREGRVYLRDEQQIIGELTIDDPGTWEDGTLAATCWDYRYPTGLYAYLGATGDGFYTIQPRPAAAAVTVFCDMTTRGGGWTGIDPETAQALGATITRLTGDGCALADGLYPEAFGTGTTECRYDIDLGFAFNDVRLDHVEITALAGSDQLADLTDSDTDWGSAVCTDRGDVRVGAASDTRTALSLGAFNEVAACGAGPSYAPDTLLDWHGAEAPVAEATVLRLELGEQGTESEGWRWSGGRFLVRRALALTGTLEVDAPGQFEDGRLAASCRDYRFPNGPYAYSGSSGDGLYRIDWDGRLAEAPADVFCDMTTDGGGWTAITIALARQRLGGLLESPGGAQQPTLLDFDGEDRPFSQDAAGDHTATYTFAVPFGYASFYLEGYQLRANSSGADVSEINATVFIQSSWALANGGANGDVSFGDATAAGPVTGYAAQGVVFNSLDAALDWPAPETLFALPVASSAFRMGWGEAGSQTEGWYPWWAGTIRVR